MEEHRNNAPEGNNESADNVENKAETTPQAASNVEKKEENVSIQLSKSTAWQLATAVLALLFVISLATGGFGIGGNEATGAVVGPPAAQPNPTPAPTPNPVEQRVTVSLDDDAVLGDENAPVTIVEFSDYECPFCGRFYTQTMPQIDSEYIQTGKVNLVFRDFPLSFHQNAQRAAEAAQCAGDQGMYYEMHDQIFDNQQSLAPSIYSSLAEAIGLDVEEFDTCLESGKFTSEVQKDFADGSAAGVSGTPSFFVGTVKDGVLTGQQIGGAQPFQVFQQIIEDELS